MIKRIVSILLALVMFATLLPAGLIGTAEAAESTGAEAGVSRIEWVQQLVETFNMTVEEDNYHDNYYSDMDESSSGYRNLLVAVEFGVIDLEAGSAFEPEQPATREFAAHTLNYCLGFQLDNSTYTYADTADVTYADDVQVAVNRGWLTLMNGRFLPQRALTSAEATAMLADAKAVIAGDVIDDDHTNTYEFADGVICVPEAVAAEVNNDVVSIASLAVTIQTGDIFVLFTEPFPSAFRAKSVSKTGGVQRIETDKVSLNDVLISIDAAGTVSGDLADFEPAEGTDITYVLADNAETHSRARAIEGRQPIKEIYLHKEIGGFSITCSLTDLVGAYKISAKNIHNIDAYVSVSGNANTSCTLPISASASQLPGSLTLGYIPVSFLGSITVSATISVDGSVTLNYDCGFEMGCAYTSQDGFRLIKDFHKKNFSLCADVTLTVGLKIQAAITELPVLSASCYAATGIRCNHRVIARSNTESPKVCAGTTAWVYAEAGCSASVSLQTELFGSLWSKSWNASLDIWTKDNSPVRSVTHIEDGVWVSACTYTGSTGGGSQGSGSFGRYYTDPSSRYYNDGRSSVTGTATYSYTLDDAGNAVITGYNGYATALSIPSTIDGYTVTKIGGSAFSYSGLRAVTIPDSVTIIGDSAFYNCKALTSVSLPDSLTEIESSAFRECTGLTSVTIPDSVTEIGESAFSGCANLSNVKLSKTLKTLGSRAFKDCTALTSIVIPKTLERIELDGYYTGPFGGCTVLKTVTLESGMTKIAELLFYNCSSLESIVIPDSVTIIGDSAFYNCKALTSVSLPDSLTEIESSAFRECTGLTSVMVPDSVTDMGTGVFANCTSLTNVTLPNIRQNIVASTFEGCTSLEKIVLPETVTAIRDSAFKNCTALKEIVWSKAPGLIEANAFYNCDALTEVEIPTTVTSVGDQAFYDCDSLTTVDFPDTVTKMGTKVFYDCDALTSVKLGSGITSIPASTFEHCDVLESIVIPRRVTTIGNSAFKDCVKFTSITIPRSVTSIGSTAFSYLNKLTIYGVAGTYAETYANDNGIKFVDKQVGATDIALNPARLTINKGASATLTLTIKPEDFTDTVSWKSSDTSVVTVSDTGVVKGVGLGTATIKVVVGSKSASCTVIVQQPVTSISLNSSSRTMDALETFQLTATANPGTAVDRRVSWSSSDPAIASVDANGLVTAYKKGSAVITVSAMDGSGVTATCKITVANNGYVCTSPTQMESPHNYPNNCGDAWIYTAAGATSLKVTFDKRTNMESGFDYLYIYNAAGEQVGKYTGTSLAGKTITVTGPSVKIKLVSDDSGNEWGFKVTGITVTSSAAPAAPVVRIGNSASSGKPMLTWNAVGGATSYRIYRSTSKGSGYSLLGTTTATSYTNTGAKAGTTYYYRVKACNDAGLSPYSNIVSGNVVVTPKPAAPVVKIGNSASSGKPMLTWNAVSGATSYKVYRATSQKGTYSLLGTVTATSYTNTGAKAGVTYWYKVKAVNSAGESAYSNIVSGQATVTTLTMGHSSTSGKPQLTWKAVSGAASYKVYRATSKNGAYSVINTTKALTYTNTGAALGTTYYYKVEVLNASGKSMGFSAIVEGKVAPVLAVGYSSVSGKPQLTWKSVPGATEYQVYRSTQQDSGYSKINTTTSTSYVNTGAKANTTYYYRIVAVKGTAVSDFSNIVSARPGK